MQKIRKQIFDNHSHIGPVSGFAYYGLPEAVKPTTDYDTIDEYLGGMDNHGIDPDLFLVEVQKLDYSIIGPNYKLNE